MPICCGEVSCLGFRGTGDLDGDGGVGEESIWDDEERYFDSAELDLKDIAKKTRTAMLVAFMAGVYLLRHTFLK